MSTLPALHAAIVTAREDRDDCLKKLRSLVSANAAAVEIFARLDGDIHELDLLYRQELSLVGNGKIDTEATP